MPSDDIAISARDLTKTYRLFSHPADRIKQFLGFGLKQYHRSFTALRNASFDLRRGESLGIVGRNGSGKSTLLQLICGILKPTSGTISVRGRVSALLELGAGFNPEFTGRENVMYQGAIFGLAPTVMADRFDTIAEFAGIGEFIDLPVRTYSSGMFIRLAFAAAIHTDPQIVVIDEALAVGDIAFQRKCFDRLYQLQEQGATLVVVSHDPYQIERLCDWVAIADRGTLSPLAPAGEALKRYRELLGQDRGASARTQGEQREGTHELRFDAITVEGETSGIDTAFRSMRPLSIVASLTSRAQKSDVRIRFEICSSDNTIVAMVTTIGLTETATFEGRHVIAFYMPCCQLTSGWYYVNAIAVDRNIRLDTWRRAAEFRVVLDDDAAFRLSSDAGAYVCQGTWTIE